MPGCFSKKNYCDIRDDWFFGPWCPSPFLVFVNTCCFPSDGDSSTCIERIIESSEQYPNLRNCMALAYLGCPPNLGPPPPPSPILFAPDVNFSEEWNLNFYPEALIDPECPEITQPWAQFNLDLCAAAIDCSNQILFTGDDYINLSFNLQMDLPDTSSMQKPIIINLAVMDESAHRVAHGEARFISS